MRAAITPDLAELLLLAGQWEAGTALVREALADLADRDAPSGDPSTAAVARLQSWWAGLSAYDPSLVGEFDHRLGELRSAARGPDAGLAHAGRIARGRPGMAGRTGN